jgi:acyl dehydratase
VTAVANSRPVTDARYVTAEDFRSGVAFEHIGRTITEADIVGFAGLTGDYNPQHVNRELGQASMFGERIAHGLLLSSLAVGMIPQRLKRFLGPMRTARTVYKRPVVMGDTIRIVGRALADPEPAGGLPRMELRVVNHRDELVSKMVLGFGPREQASLARPPQPPADAVELSFEQVLAGVLYRTPGRTLTEAHIVGFSQLTGDWLPAYADAEWAMAHGPGTRVAQEMLIIATAAPMVPLDTTRLIAARDAKISWHRPALLGDTMYVQGRFVKTLPIEQDDAVQEFHEFSALNQRDEPLATLELSLVMQRPSGSS